MFKEFTPDGWPIVRSGKASYGWLKNLDLGENHSFPMKEEKRIRTAASKINGRGKIRLAVRRGDGLIWVGRVG